MAKRSETVRATLDILRASRLALFKVPSCIEASRVVFLKAFAKVVVVL